MTASVGLLANVCQLSSLRIVICPEASSAHDLLPVLSAFIS
jgi:hypothetical protein